MSTKPESVKRILPHIKAHLTVFSRLSKQSKNVFNMTIMAMISGKEVFFSVYSLFFFFLGVFFRRQCMV